MATSKPVDGFALTYDRIGPREGPSVMLLHGWPGDRTDYDAVVERFGKSCDLIVPDLRGFGSSDKHLVDPTDHYGVEGQARSVVGLIEELALENLVIGGYDIGSRIAQILAKTRPELVKRIVVGPPAPGVGARMLGEGPMQEFWYQAFNRLTLSEEIIDGNAAAVRAYLRHIWTRWSGPDFTDVDKRVAHLTPLYATPGAFIASIGWYRSGDAAVARALREISAPMGPRIAVPTTFLWPDCDPLFPKAWSDRIDEFFSDAQIVSAGSAGHFLPVEVPDLFSEALQIAVGKVSGSK